MDENQQGAGVPGGATTPPPVDPVAPSAGVPDAPVSTPEPTVPPVVGEVPPAPPAEPTVPPAGGPPPAEPVSQPSQPGQSDPTPSGGWGDQNTGGGAPVA